MMKKELVAAVVLTAAFVGYGDVTLENRRARLVIGDDATAKSLVLKATGEELLDAHEGIPMFTVTQERPYHNEIKLTWPNKRTAYPANSSSRTARFSPRPVCASGRRTFRLAPSARSSGRRQSDEVVEKGVMKLF